MIWIFVLLLILCAVLLQRNTAARSLTRLRADHRPERNLAEPGEPFDLVLTLRNASRRWIPFAEISEQLPPDFLTDDRRVSRTAWLRPGQVKEYRVPVRIEKRGRYVLMPVTISAGDFLGLGTEQTQANPFREVVVLPKETDAPAVEQILGGFLGDRSVSRWIYEDPVLISGFHEYTGREPMRDISWTRTLQSGQMMVRSFDHTAESDVCVLLNAEGADRLPQEAFEACCSLARTVCRLLEDGGTEYRFMTNAAMAGDSLSGNSVPSGLGEQHLSAVLECLGRATTSASLPAERLIFRAAEDRRTRGMILITPDPSADDLPVLKRWKDEGSSLLLLHGTEAAS